MKQVKWSTLGICAVLTAGIAGGAYLFLGSREPDTTGGPITFRRLSESQYAESIKTAFGGEITIPGRFDPPRREDGLLAIGNGRVVISRSGFEQAELRAREIASQVVQSAKEDSVLGCATKSPTAFDEQCATEVIRHYGKQLYRRPLHSKELTTVLDVTKGATAAAGQFAVGLEAGLSRLLISPNFLYRIENVAGYAEEKGIGYLDDYSLASRISFLLWDAPPDEELLKAAEIGALQSQRGVTEQVERMIASPKFERGVRAFFSDMYGYEQFEGLSKEQEIFPAFSSQLAADAKEQSLKIVVDLLVTQQGDYRQLFTTKTTFLNRRLSALYEVPAPDAAMTGWAPYTFTEDDKRAGLLTQAGFLMLDTTHEGRTSPTIRGKEIRELYLCQKVPPPPPAVDFQLVQDTENPAHRTARDRLSVHATVPTCAGCHAITDPIGLSLEHYNAVGIYRTTENDAPIDASGTFEGKSYENAIELQKILSESSSVTDCLAKRIYEYGVGRPVNSGENEWMSYLRQNFAKEQFKIAPLMRNIATSSAFRTISISGDSGISIAAN